MQIRVISKSDDSISTIDLSEFMFQDFTLEFNNDTTLSRDDLMFYIQDYDFYIRLSPDHSWTKIFI